MLEATLRLTAAAAATVCSLLLLSSAPAAAKTVCDPITLTCTVDNGSGGSPGAGGGGHTSAPGEFSPGPSTCSTKSGDRTKDVEVPCSENGNPWYAPKNCYLALQEPQGPAPAGKDGSVGARYVCKSWDDCLPPVDPVLGCTPKIRTSFWLDSPPPGFNRYTPAQAAAALVKTFRLKGVDIGIVPHDAPGFAGTVGLPVWLWVENPEPLSYGPYTETATLGGVTVTATAKVTQINWGMGDGKTVTCPGPGTPWNHTVDPSPDCGYRYYEQSAGQPGDAYTVTANSQWTVDWSGAGQSGQIPLQATSQTQIRIGEIQTIIK